MRVTKWFDRKFDFSGSVEQYTSLYERLQRAPAMYAQTVAILPEHVLKVKPQNKWSIQENIGHLIVLEALWLKRFQDIKENKAELSPADLSNTATNEAGFNELLLSDLLESLSKERTKTITFLDSLKQHDFKNTSLHPRLQQPMRIVDLMYFVAEHDDHHLNTILKIIQNYQL